MTTPSLKSKSTINVENRIVTKSIHPEMTDVNLETEELLSVTFEDKPQVDMVFTPDDSFKDKIRDYFNFDDFDGDIVIRT